MVGRGAGCGRGEDAGGPPEEHPGRSRSRATRQGWRISGETTRGLAAFSLNNVPPPVIDSASLVRLGDGRFQFQFSAPGSSQATVWGSTNLSAWENLQAVPVMGNSAQFIDNAAPAHPHRFYKVSVP